MTDTVEINVENFKLQMEDLRSGVYAQTQNYLCNKLSSGENGYCCLGVMEETYITNVDGRYKKYAEYNDCYYYYDIEGGRNSTYVWPFTRVGNWIFPYVRISNIEIELPHSVRDDEYDDLKHFSFPMLNDNLLLTHSQIADVAEWYFLNGGNGKALV